MGKFSEFLEIKLPYKVFVGVLDGTNKIVFIDGTNNCHYTLLFNDYDRIVDLHRNPHGATYESIFKIPYADWNAISEGFVSVSSVVNEKFLEGVRQISLGKLRRMGGILMSNVDDNTAEAFINIRGKENGKRYSMHKKIRREIIEERLITPDDMWENTGMSFTFFQKRGGRLVPKGVVFKTERSGHFVFVSLEAQVKYAKFLLQCLEVVVKNVQLKNREAVMGLLEMLK